MSANNLVLIFVVSVTVITFVVAVAQVVRPRRPASATAPAPAPTPSAPPVQAAPSFSQEAFRSACEAADRELHDRLAKGHTATILGYLQPPPRASPDPKA